MARPTTKEELMFLGNEQYKKLWKMINSMSVEQQNFKFNFDEDIGKEAHWKRDKNIRDVLIHLYEWHRLLLNWVNSNQKGEEKPFLPSPYNWKTYADMNVEIWKKHQDTSYDRSKEMIKQSHADVISLIEKFSNEELFTKKYFSWTGGSSLGQYCVSAISSHYDWAMKKIKAHIKICKLDCQNI